MNANEFILIHEDGYHTTVYPSLSDQETIKGTVVVLHGLAEHHNRYREFSLFLNNNGYDVYLYDHRGHGTDKKLTDLGYIADSRGWEKLILDAVDVLSYVSDHKRGKKLILFGHSMGSLIARGATEYSDLVNAAVFCGTTAPPILDSLSGLFVTNLVKLLKGKRHISPFLNNVLFGRKPYRTLSERTQNDWLTRSNAAVGLYMNDPYCGFICTAGLYHDLVKLATVVTKPANIKNTRKNLPIFFLSGDCDPVGSYGEGVRQVANMYRTYGQKDVDVIFYKGGRHEILNEINRLDVFGDISHWLEERLAPPAAEAVQEG